MSLDFKIPYLKIIKVNVGVVCFILISDLNGVFEALIGISQLLSPLILFLSLTNLSLVIIHNKYFIFNKVFIFIIIFYSFYFIFSGIIRLLNYNNLSYGIPFYTLFTSYFSSVLIISAIYFSIVFLIKNNQIQFIYNNVLLALVFSTATVIYTDLFGVGNFAQIEENLDNSRASGFFGNPNEAGFIANLCLIFLMFFFIENKKNKFLIILFMIGSLYASFRSFSKISMLFSVLLVGYFFFFMYKHQLKKRIFLKLGVTMILSILVLLSTYAINNIDELTKDWDSNQKLRIEAVTLLLTKGDLESTSDSERAEGFNTGLRMIKENLLVGKGYGYLQFGIISNKQGVHNTYIMIFGESGIIGFLLFILIFISLFIFLWEIRNHKSLFFLICSIVSLILLNCLSSHSILTFRPIIVCFSLLSALTIKYSKIECPFEIDMDTISTNKIESNLVIKNVGKNQLTNLFVKTTCGKTASTSCAITPTCSEVSFSFFQL